MKRGAPLGYRRREHWPTIQATLAQRPATMYELAATLGMHPERVRQFLRHMRRERLAYVQVEGSGTKPAVWHARRP